MSKLDKALRKMNAAARADSSPEMIAFMARQAERRAKAETGERKCQLLIDRATAAIKQLKKLNATPTPGRASNALHSSKMAKANYSLAINNLSNSIRYDEWMAKAELDFSAASTAVDDLEENVRRVTRMDADWGTPAELKPARAEALKNREAMWAEKDRIERAISKRWQGKDDRKVADIGLLNEVMNKYVLAHYAFDSAMGAYDRGDKTRAEAHLEKARRYKAAAEKKDPTRR